MNIGIIVFRLLKHSDELDIKILTLRPLPPLVTALLSPYLQYYQIDRI